MSPNTVDTDETRNFAPKSFVDLPNELKAEIYELMPLGNLQSLQRLHRNIIRPDLKPILERRFRCLLEMFVANTESFASVLEESLSIISGSCAVWIINGPLYFTPNDMDVCTTNVGMRRLVDHLVNFEGYGGADDSNTRGVELVLKESVAAFTRHWEEEVRDTYASISGVGGVIKLNKGGKKVDIILSEDHKSCTPVMSYYMTGLMNALEGSGRLRVMYPRQTLNHVSILRLPVTPIIAECLYKYGTRGFDIVTRPELGQNVLYEEGCLGLVRATDDQFTETIYFGSKPETPTLICSSKFRILPGYWAAWACADWGCSRSMEYQLWKTLERELLRENAGNWLAELGLAAETRTAALGNLSIQLKSAMQARMLIPTVIELCGAMYRCARNVHIASFSLEAYSRANADALGHGSENIHFDAKGPCHDYLTNRLETMIGRHEVVLQSTCVDLKDRVAVCPIPLPNLKRDIHEMSECLVDCASLPPSEDSESAARNWRKVLELTKRCGPVITKFDILLGLVTEIRELCRDPTKLGITQADPITSKIVCMRSAEAQVLSDRIDEARNFCGYPKTVQETW